MADDRTYIKLHDGMPGHPKVRGLSDRAFRTYVTALCHCSQYLTDGFIAAAVARDFGPPKVWSELTGSGLVDPDGAGFRIHDYLEHQRSAAEVAAIKAGKGDSGSFGNHIRWHVKRDRFDPDCRHCGVADGIADGSQVRSDGESESESRTDRETSPTTETETDKKKTSSSSAPKRARRIPDDFVVTEEMRTWARREGFGRVDLDAVTDEFRDYWRAVPGAKGTKLDWPATWRNRVREVAQRRGLRVVTAGGSELPDWERFQ